jgi:hypothetical protein
MPAVIIGYQTLTKKKDPVLKWLRRQDHTCLMPNFYLVNPTKLTALGVWQKLSPMVESTKNKLVVMEAPATIHVHLDPEPAQWLVNKFSFIEVIPIKDEQPESE